MAGRARLDVELRLTDRDRELLSAVYWHGCFTTDQLTALFFRTLRRAQRRLLWLQRHGFLERFFPAVPRNQGRSPGHYLLGEAGASVVARILGMPVRDLAWQRLENLVAPTIYEHLMEVNEFFVELIRGTSRCRGHGLARWASARECLRLFSDWVGKRELLPRIRPDGWAEVLHPRGVVPFFLELDRGTESGAVLEKKVLRYLRHHREHGNQTITVLFLPPSPRRAAFIREVVQSAVRREEKLEYVERGPEITFWVCEDPSGRDVLEWVWSEAPGARLARLHQLPSFPAADLRPEDCLGRRWQRWARELGGVS